MKKHPFLIFIGVVGALIISLIIGIQSPGFARLLQSIAVRHLPANMGIDGGFADFKIGLFPPTITIRKPHLIFRKNNIAHVPVGSIDAEKLELRFRPFQALSGNIRVHEVSLVNGDVTLLIEAQTAQVGPQKKSFKLNLGWDELFQIRAEAVSLLDTRLHIKTSDSAIQLDFLADHLRIGQWSGKGGLGYEISLALKEIHGEVLKHSVNPIQFVSCIGHLNALGLDIESLDLGLEGVAVNAKGTVKGAIFNPKTLLLDANVNAKSDLRRFLPAVFPTFKDAGDAQGNLEFNGRILGNALLAENLHADGSLTVTDAKFKTWSADKVQIEGAWAGGGSGISNSDLTVAHASIVSREQPRTGGFQPGGGGKIEIGSFKMSLGFQTPFQVPVTFDRAHIHWLAPMALKDIYPLDFRVSGPLTANIVPPTRKSPFKISTKEALKIDEFQLDNQKLNATKPLHRVLKIPRINFDGTINVDKSGVYPVATVSLPNTSLALTGKVDFKTGYDLHAQGKVHLKDIGTIADNEIHGDGNLEVHVHGPSYRVYADFDTDVKDAYYINLELGDLKGRITWDDHPGHLLFDNIWAKKGRTEYRVNGIIDIDNNTPQIDVGVDSGNIQDFTQIFSHLTKDLWWFPHTVAGPFSGQIKVSGGISLEDLVVDGKIIGANWEYLGEHFGKVNLTGGYDRGKYHVSDAKILKRSGRISGNISFSQYDRLFDWHIHTDDFTVTDLDHIARLDIPIRGRLAFETNGHGKEGSVKSSSQVSLNDFVVRGSGMPPSLVSLVSDSGLSTVKGSVFGGQGIFDMTYDFARGVPSEIHGTARQFDFSPILLLLNSQSIQDPALAGYISGSANIGFPRGDLNLITGKLDVNEYVLARSGSRFQLAKPISLRMDEGTFNLDDLDIHGNQGDTHVSLQGKKGTLDGSVRGDLDLSIVEFLTSAVVNASGIAKLDFDVAGRVSSPSVIGKSYIRDGLIRVNGLDSPFENVVGNLQLVQNVLTIQSLESDLAGGRVLGEGTVTLFPDRVPSIALNGTLTGSKLKIYPFQFVKIRGGLKIHGDDLPYMVDGNIIVDSAFTQKRFFEKQTEGVKAVRYLPPPTIRGEGNYPTFKLNIDAIADCCVVIKNDLFDAEAKGHVTVVNTLSAPRILGTAEIVQGKMVFKDRSFQIQSASANFDSPTEINPTFDLTAVTDVNGTKIQLYAAGRMSGNWKVDFSSTPAMAEPDILSLLALGTDTRKLKAGDRSVVEQGEAASLLLHSLDFNREVQNKTGLQIEVDESVNTQIATSAFRPQTQLESNSAPRLVIKRQVGKNVELSYGSTVGVGSGTEKEVNAEVKVTPAFSVIGVWDNTETVDTQNQPLNNNSYGMDLKVQKRFK